MNRKAFIQRLGLVGAGLVLTPIRLFASNSNAKTYQLPRPTIHIPHGNFASSNLEKLTIPEYGLECTVQLFLRNGIEPSSDDLKVLSFQRQNEWMSICLTRNGNSSVQGEISGIELAVDSFHDTNLLIRKR